MRGFVIFLTLLVIDTLSSASDEGNPFGGLSQALLRLQLESQLAQLQSKSTKEKHTLPEAGLSVVSENFF